MNKKRVLVLCTGNSCRSQMAEGILRHLAGDRMEVFSAGVRPMYVHPLAVKVMAEAGMDISKHRSKSVNEFIGESFDTVITVCDNARQVCPVFPGECERIHWNIPDPVLAHGSEEEKFAEFRKIRDEIAQKIKEWIKQK